MLTRPRIVALCPTLCSLMIAAGTAQAEMVVFENASTLGALNYYDPNFGNVIYGQSLDITRAASDQPAAGETPVGSIFFMHVQDLNGDFIWMGTGTVTNTAESTDGTLIPIPLAPEGIAYYGPQAFGEGDTVDSGANFVEGWRPIHGYNDLTGVPGAFTVDESFTVGIVFEGDTGMHYGFAEFDLSYSVKLDVVDLDIVPVRWGFNDVAGEAAIVTPAPASGLILGVGVLGLTRRRR